LGEAKSLSRLEIFAGLSAELREALSPVFYFYERYPCTMMKKINKIISILLCCVFFCQQTCVAQSVDLSNALARAAGVFSPPQFFRPVVLRSIEINPATRHVDFLLDKGDRKNLSAQELAVSSKELIRYFVTAMRLPGSVFWVNLRPDSPERIIDQKLEGTEAGRILLEADVRLKKDLALATSPDTQEGKEYWDKLYHKAEELFGSQQVTIPTLTRPWIVPGEIILRQTKPSASNQYPSVYIYKATLKVMLEEDYLNGSQQYAFSDPRMKALNRYASQLLKERIIPHLTRSVNSSQEYASLRQLYYSLILAKWCKAAFSNRENPYARLTAASAQGQMYSSQPWDKQTYFLQYQKSFRDGEYQVKRPAYSNAGQVIRTYTSGGADFVLPLASVVETQTPVIPESIPLTRVPLESDSQAPAASSLPIRVKTKSPISYVSTSGAETAMIRLATPWIAIELDLKQQRESDARNSDILGASPRILLIGGRFEEVRFILSKYPGAHITVVELYHEMLSAIAEEVRIESQANRFPISWDAACSQITLIQDDAGAIKSADTDYPADSFDMVVANGVDESAFLNKDDAARVMSGIFALSDRVLKPRGYFIQASWTPQRYLPAAPLLINEDLFLKKRAVPSIANAMPSDYVVPWINTSSSGNATGRLRLLFAAFKDAQRNFTKPRILLVGARSEEVRFLLQMFPDAQITAVEIYLEFLQKIQEDLAGDPDLQARVHLVQADVSRADLTGDDFQGASYDLVICNGIDGTAFRDANVERRVLQGLIRQVDWLLKPDGVLAHQLSPEEVQYYTENTGLVVLKRDGFPVLARHFLVKGSATKQVRSQEAGVGAIAFGALLARIESITSRENMRILLPEIPLPALQSERFNNAQTRILQEILRLRQHQGQSLNGSQRALLQRVEYFLKAQNPRAFYFFNALVESSHDYALGFGKTFDGTAVVGLAVDLMEQLTDEELAEYLFHEIAESLTPAGVHRSLYVIGNGEYDGIQRKLFMSHNALGERLRSFIDDRARAYMQDMRKRAQEEYASFSPLQPLRHLEQAFLRNGEQIELTDREMDLYFGPDKARQLRHSGVRFIVRGLRGDRDKRFLDVWKEEVASDRVKVSEWQATMQQKYGVGRELPYFHYIESGNDSVAFGLISVTNGVEHLEGFLSVAFLDYTDRGGCDLTFAQMEVSHRNIGRDAELPGVADLLFDFSTKVLAERMPLDQVHFLTMQTMSPGSSQFAARTGFLQQKSNSWALTFDTLESRYRARQLKGFFNGKHDENDSGIPGQTGGIDLRLGPLVVAPSAAIFPTIPITADNAKKKSVEEWGDIERLLAAGITPSSERLIETVQYSLAGNTLLRDRARIISCLAKILRDEEISDMPTADSLRQVIILVEHE